MSADYDSRVDTWAHIARVRQLLGDVITRLLVRADVHDRSKLESPEKEVFDVYSPKLPDIVYGSEEYEQMRREMGAALEHHYELNPHHPEHYAAGIAGMSLLDLIEMLADWKAATERHRPTAPAAPGRADAPQYDSDLLRSIALNQERFGYSDEVRLILENTVREFGWGSRGGGRVTLPS